MSVRRFSAEILPKFKQGDHEVIAVHYVTDDGEKRRVSTVILPEKIAAEFMELINGKSPGSADTPRIVINEYGHRE